MTPTTGRVLNQPFDISCEAESLANTYFLGNQVSAFDSATGTGLLQWQRYGRKPRMAFDQIAIPFEATPAWEFPPEYAQDPALPFEISFVTPRTIRVRLQARDNMQHDTDSPMLAGTPGTTDAWHVEENDEQIRWNGPCGSVILRKDPWHLELRDAEDRLLTSTQHLTDTRCLQNCYPIPFSFVRRVEDVGRQFAATFSLAPDEKIYGCGESFTRLNKRGQQVILWACDAYGVQTRAMYKPIPFFLSSRGYGIFVHSSAPMTFDFGHTYDAATTLHVGDEALELFFFMGTPQEIVEEYTALTGRSPLPPLWSFGLWMSRITYKSEDETREVAALLRRHRIPCDVIHLDTGWFETNWRCNYEFSPSRFTDPATMIRDLRAQGFRISLWQLPYFTPTNSLYREAIARGYVVRNSRGNAATEDAIIDFSNPEAVRWYQQLLAGVLQLGVGAIKVDFGESAPLDGLYASGRTGWYEHNLYPLRYNQAAAEITREITGEQIIWARSAWAGSQRYPLHWGGDAENTDCGMAASLRGGLSLGLCGFSFWSHDIGGFVQRSPEALYRRWLPFGMLTSHSRCHGAPPKEPWAYGEEFVEIFRRAVELKYRLLPYIYAQAKISSAHGWPLLRPLFFAYPHDPTAWLIEDAYLLGNDLLVAPLMEETTGRDVYLPAGTWVDYQTGARYAGGQWHHLPGGDLAIVLCVRAGAAIPMIEVAQSTADLDWTRLTLRIYPDDDTAVGWVFRPGDISPQQIQARHIGDDWQLAESTLCAQVTWTVLPGTKSQDQDVSRPDG